MVNALRDSSIMCKRNLLLLTRMPESLITATLIPFFLMLLFGGVFGGIADVGAISYVSFVLPGIMLQAIAQSNASTAISVSIDVNRGIVDRFRSMDIAKSSVLVGHAFTSTLKHMLSAAVMIGTAFILDFEPTASLGAWLAVVGLVLLIATAFTWLGILCGLVSKTPEAASGYMFPLFILPFVSSGFAPIETMPRWLGIFAQYQPMTPIIDSLRGLMLGLPMGNALPIAIAWCVGITAITFILSVRLYNRKSA